MEWMREPKGKQGCEEEVDFADFEGSSSQMVANFVCTAEN